MSRQSETMSAQLWQQTRRYQREIAALQQKVIKQQSDMGRMKQQLHDATCRADRAEAASTALR